MSCGSARPALETLIQSEERPARPFGGHRLDAAELACCFVQGLLDRLSHKTALGPTLAAAETREAGLAHQVLELDAELDRLAGIARQCQMADTAAWRPCTSASALDDLDLRSAASLALECDQQQLTHCMLISGKGLQDKHAHAGQHLLPRQQVLRALLYL